MYGLHLTADLSQCRRGADAMTDPLALRSRCLHAVQASGLQAVGDLFHRFETPAQAVAPAGVTGVVLLAESHLAVHTWPEFGVVTLDVYVCNRGVDNAQPAQALLEALIEVFGPVRTERHRLERGAPATGS